MFGIEEATAEFKLQGAEFKRQGDQYYDLFKPLLEDGGVLSKAAKTGQLVGCSLAFAQACFGIAAITNVIVGISAQRALNDFHLKLGRDINTMSKDLGLLVTHENQQKFGRHVFNFVKMRMQQLEIVELQTGSKQYTFVYHHGNDWHGLFTELFQNDNERFSPDSSGKLDQNSTSAVQLTSPRFIGMFDNFNTLTAAMQIIRKVVGTDAGFHILVPTTELTVINEPLAFPPEVHPLTLEGELHSGTGRPYYHVNFPGSPQDMFCHVQNLAEPQPEKEGPSLGRKAAAVFAAVGAGVGGGIAGTAAGFLTVAIGFAIFPAAAPIAVGLSAWGLMAGGAAAAGTASALSAGKAVEDGFEEKDRDAARERARAINAAAKRR